MAERSREIQTFRIELGEKTEFSDYKKNRINQTIKSIVIGRASNPSVVIHARTKEGDEFYLHAGRVVNFKNTINGITFSWPAYTGEWVEINISENEPLVGFTPLQPTSLASNISNKRFISFVDLPFAGYGGGQTKLAGYNPNRIKLEIEIIGPRRVMIGDYENTKDTLTFNEKLEKNTGVMPFTKIELATNEEVWAIDDDTFMNVYQQGIGMYGQIIKVTEYLK